jgi:hypothetical protein
MELACALLRTPLLRRFAAHVFFARRSFPDMAPQGRALVTDW